MLFRVFSLVGRPVEGREGRIGEVAGLYFDDNQWALRYFLLRAEQATGKEQFLLAPDALDGFDPRARLLRTRLSCAQIRSSPDVDIRPVISPEQEEPLARHFGWPDYGSSIAVQNEHVEAKTAGAMTVMIDRKSIYHTLRELGTVRGFRVVAPDGEIGMVVDFIAGTGDWQLEYFVVDTGERLDGKAVFAAPEWIELVQWETGRMRSRMSRSTLDGSPAYDGAAVVDEQRERELYEYFAAEAATTGRKR